MVKKLTRMSDMNASTRSQNDKSLSIYKSRKDLFIDNLIGGISWGVGSVVGATVVIGMLGFVIAQTQSIPFLGKIVNVVTTEIQQQQTHSIFQHK